MLVADIVLTYNGERVIGWPGWLRDRGVQQPTPLALMWVPKAGMAAV